MRIWHLKSRKYIKIFAVLIAVSGVLFMILQIYQWFRIRKTPEEGGNTAQDLTPNQDPEPSVPVDPEDVGLDFVLDTDYSAITVETEFPSYAKDTEEIRYTITNSHEGKGFYYFFIPYIEYYDSGSWTRLAYYPPEYYQENGRWCLCGIENSAEKNFSVSGRFCPEYISGEVKDGLYRLVIFVGDKKIYGPFELKS